MGQFSFPRLIVVPLSAACPGLPWVFPGVSQRKITAAGDLLESGNQEQIAASHEIDDSFSSPTLGIWPGEGFYLPDPCELTFFVFFLFLAFFGSLSFSVFLLSYLFHFLFSVEFLVFLGFIFSSIFHLFSLSFRFLFHHPH